MWIVDAGGRKGLDWGMITQVQPLLRVSLSAQTRSSALLCPNVVWWSSLSTQNVMFAFNLKKFCHKPRCLTNIWLIVLYFCLFLAFVLVQNTTFQPENDVKWCWYDTFMHYFLPVIFPNCLKRPGRYGRRRLCLCRTYNGLTAFKVVGLSAVTIQGENECL